MFSKTWIKTAVGCTAVTALGAGLAGQTHAQDMYDFDPVARPYIGANVGLYKSGEGDYDEDRDLWELYGGVKFGRHFGVEANWTNLGNMSREGLDFDVDVSIDGWGLAAVGEWPMTDAFSVYGKLGVLFWDADVDINDLESSFDGEEPFVTLGAGFGVTDPLAVTLEYTRYNADLELDELADNSDVGDIDSVKLGLRYTF